MIKAITLGSLRQAYNKVSGSDLEPHEYTTQQLAGHILKCKSGYPYSTRPNASELEVAATNLLNKVYKEENI